MMSEWIRAALDVVLIITVTVGLIQALRLIGHLRDLRKGRVDMERFVYEFNTTVMRAEAGIKGLRQAARESGDDLEKLVEKAVVLRDELQFIVEHADQLAERISRAASTINRTEGAGADTPVSGKQAASKSAPLSAKDPVKTQDKQPAPTPAAPAETTKNTPSSRAEKELLQALQKLN